MYRWSLLIKAVLLAAAVLGSRGANAAEYPIGMPQQRHGMEIGAVYLQPIAMEPDGMMRKAADSDVHIEADIRALANNPNGFADGEWIPYLLVKYEITKIGHDQKITGDFMPMVASDGPHYGDNIKLMGPGRYRVIYTIYPPNAPENGHGGHFGRHTDRATGVRPWFKPLEVEYEFTFAGIGKKGGY
jgi:hypothetical protein